MCNAPVITPAAISQTNTTSYTTIPPLLHKWRDCNGYRNDTFSFWSLAGVVGVVGALEEGIRDADDAVGTVAHIAFKDGVAA